MSAFTAYKGLSILAKTPSGDAGQALQSNFTTIADQLAANVANAAPLASPAFTGTPTAPTAAAGTTTTQIATTAFVAAAVAVVNAAVATLTNGSPSTLDTFLEAYNRFLADESAATALTTLVGTKITAAQAATQISTAVSAYLPLAGGTVTGPTTFNAPVNFGGNVAGGFIECSILQLDGAGVLKGYGFAPLAIIPFGGYPLVLGTQYTSLSGSVVDVALPISLRDTLSFANGASFDGYTLTFATGDTLAVGGNGNLLFNGIIVFSAQQ